VILTWHILSDEEAQAEEDNRCNVRRTKRSIIQCEQDQRRHADFHAGRGARGTWFTWPIEAEDP